MIIGVIGTMIALLPTLGEKFLGTDWISSDLILLSASLAFLFIFGALLLFGIFIILIKKIWSGNCRKEEESCFSWKYFSWIKKGDRSRCMLTFCLVPMMAALLGFLLIILFNNPNDFVRYSTLIVIVLILFLAYGIFIIDNLVIELIKLFKRNRKDGVVLVIIFCIIAAAFFIFFSCIPPESPRENQIPQNIKITTDSKFYHPKISSEQALLLEATNTSSVIYGNNLLHWTTNYGYFVRIEVISKIILLGNQTNQTSSNLIGNQKIYWVYPISDIGKEKPPVNITLEIMRGPNDKIIANSSLNLIWIDKDIITSS